MSETLETALMLALGLGLGWLARLGMRRGIGEARFDATGRRIMENASPILGTPEMERKFLEEARRKQCQGENDDG